MASRSDAHWNAHSTVLRRQAIAALEGSAEAELLARATALQATLQAKVQKPAPATLREAEAMSEETPLPYYRQRFLLSAGEFRFYEALKEAVQGRFEIMMQVRVGALLRVGQEDWHVHGRKVSQKSFDFALLRPGSSYVVAVIELDDRTHELPDRKARDAFIDKICAEAELPLIRFPVRKTYRPSVIRTKIFAKLPGGADGFGSHSAPEPQAHK